MSEKSAPPDAPPPYPVQELGQSAFFPTAPPGQPGDYPPQPQQPMIPGQPPMQAGTTVIVSQPAVAAVNQFTQHPARMTCPSCQQNVETTIEREIGLFAWLIVGMLFLFGFAIPLVWLGFCFIPLCIPSCKDVRHSCPNCKTHLGTYVIAK